MWPDAGIVLKHLTGEVHSFDQTALRKVRLLDAQSHEPKRVVTIIDFAIAAERPALSNVRFSHETGEPNPRRLR